MALFYSLLSHGNAIDDSLLSIHSNELQSFHLRRTYQAVISWSWLLYIRSFFNLLLVNCQRNAGIICKDINQAVFMIPMYNNKIQWIMVDIGSNKLEFREPSLISGSQFYLHFVGHYALFMQYSSSDIPVRVLMLLRENVSLRSSLGQLLLYKLPMRDRTINVQLLPTRTTIAIGL